MSDLNWHKSILKSPFRNSEVRGLQGMVQIKYLKEYFLLSLRVRLYVWVGGFMSVCLCHIVSELSTSMMMSTVQM